MAIVYSGVYFYSAGGGEYAGQAKRYAAYWMAGGDCTGADVTGRIEDEKLVVDGCGRGCVYGSGAVFLVSRVTGRVSYLDKWSVAILLKHLLISPCGCADVCSVDRYGIHMVDEQIQRIFYKNSMIDGHLKKKKCWGDGDHAIFAYCDLGDKEACTEYDAFKWNQRKNQIRHSE